jgi:hypothetical protein
MDGAVCTARDLTRNRALRALILLDGGGQLLYGGLGSVKK